MEKTPQGGRSTTVDTGRDEPEVLFECRSHPYRRFVLSSLDEIGDERHQSETYGSSNVRDN